jgi:putative aminopeptidase FrvX
VFDALDLIRELTSVPGPPGQEDPVRDAVANRLRSLDLSAAVDAKGNLVVNVPGTSEPEARASVVVTAHLDELALMVTEVDASGGLHVVPMGGLHPWKWGEQPVEVLADGGALTGVLSFGCIHTSSPHSVAQQARSAPLVWDQATVFTGRSPGELRRIGVRPGNRVVLARARREVIELGQHVAAYFLDDRADLAAWLIALQTLIAAPLPVPVVFAATVSEEVGGEGALYLLHSLRPDVCIALEIGPSVPESPGPIDEQPTIWVTDTFSSMAARDATLLAMVAEECGMRPRWQALTNGGSDASCAASRGAVARPITLGLPVENSHGLEIMHREAVDVLARYLVEVLRRLSSE